MKRKRHLLATRLLLSLLALLTASTAWAQAPATIGGIVYNSVGGYYEIDEPDDLRDLATYVNGTGTYRDNSTETTAHDCEGLKFKMTQDITFTATTAWDVATTEEDNNFVPIGGYYNSAIRYFQGDFDGAGHTVSGIRIHRSGSADADKNQGVFGRIGSGANIHGLHLADARITGYDSTGGIVGHNNGGTVTDCHVASNVCIHAVQNNAYYHGGITGRNEGTIANCTSAATLTIPSNATNCGHYGAIAGFNSGGTLRDNLAIGATVPTADSNWHGAIVGATLGGTLQRNYYTACKVAGVANATGKGCRNADVTANDGAVSVHTITLGEGIAITSPAEPTVTYGSTGYYAQGSTITLGNTVPAPAGYQYSYTASAGTLSGSTLTMPAADVTISAVLAAIPWAGDGSSSSPYIIEYPSQLDLLAHRVNGTHGETAVEDGYSGKYFQLGADINYTYSKEWDEATTEDDNNYEAIGGYYGWTDRYFCGDFDGAGHTISGIRIHRSGSDHQGIFGRTGSGATIHGLRLADARITGYDYTGGIVGLNNGTVTDCHVANNVCIHAAQTDACFHGGITGRNEGTIANCTSAATLTIPTGATGCQFYGAIAGYSGGTLSDNLAIGATVPAADINLHGAIVGYNSSYGTLQHNYYTACKVASADVTPSGVGCANADVAEMTKSNVTYYDGAVPALRDNADNTWAITLLAALASTANGHTPLDLGWGEGQFPLQLASRTLYKDGKWNTLCLPFDLTVSGSVLDGAVARPLDEAYISGTTLSLTFGDAVATLVAGTPYIIKWAKADDYVDDDAHNIVNPVFEGVTVSTDKNDYDTAEESVKTDERVRFVGTYKSTAFDNDDTSILLMGAANTLYYPTTGAGIGAQRAYFKIGNEALLARRLTSFSIDFGEGEDEATGIISVTSETRSNADGWYSLDGRKLVGKPTQNGIYINNGKKVVIK